jgi:hypothetical protein
VCEDLIFGSNFLRKGGKTSVKAVANHIFGFHSISRHFRTFRNHLQHLADLFVNVLADSIETAKPLNFFLRLDFTSAAVISYYTIEFYTHIRFTFHIPWRQYTYKLILLRYQSIRSDVSCFCFSLKLRKSL